MKSSKCDAVLSPVCPRQAGALVAVAVVDSSRARRPDTVAQARRVVDAEHDAIAAALEDLADRAVDNANRYAFWRKLYEFLHVAIGLPAVVFAGAATVGALEESEPALVAILAGIATVLSAVQLFVRPADRAAFNRSQQIEFVRLELRIRHMRDIELGSLEASAARAQLTSLREALYDALQRTLK